MGGMRVVYGLFSPSDHHNTLASCWQSPKGIDVFRAMVINGMQSSTYLAVIIATKYGLYNFLILLAISRQISGKNQYPLIMALLA